MCNKETSCTGKFQGVNNTFIILVLFILLTIILGAAWI